MGTTRKNGFIEHPVVCKILEWVVTGVVFAIVASILSSVIMTHIEEKNKINEQLSNLSDIFIGCNKEWVDERFGTPQFSGKNGEYTLCAYISDYFVIQMAFDEAESAQAYLITALKNEENVKVEIDDFTLKYMVEDPKNVLTLGDFSYYDFPGKPESVFGFVSNGTTRMLYSESYYYFSGGNYYNYHIATFDFGKIDGGINWLLCQFGLPPDDPDDFDDELNSQFNNKGVQIIRDRKNNRPNTYGVSTLETDILELLFTYNWFNSQQLRNRLNKVDLFP